MDIDVNVGEYRFLVRCSAIITDEYYKKILLFRVKGREEFLLPGGRVCFMESSGNAIKREIKEELGIDSLYNLVCVNENFIESRNIQSIEFIYHTVVNDIDKIKPLENKNQEFIVVNISDIDNYNLKPDTLKEIIKNRSDNIICKVNYE